MRILILLIYALTFLWAGREYGEVFLLSFAAGLFTWEFGYWGITGRWFWFALLKDDGGKAAG